MGSIVIVFHLNGHCANAIVRRWKFRPCCMITNKKANPHHTNPPELNIHQKNPIAPEIIQNFIMLFNSFHLQLPFECPSACSNNFTQQFDEKLLWNCRKHKKYNTVHFVRERSKLNESEMLRMKSYPFLLSFDEFLRVSIVGLNKLKWITAVIGRE